MQYIDGLREIESALRALPAKLRRQALRNSLAAGARVFRDEAKRMAPVLAVPVRDKAGKVVRKPGTLRKAITVRTSKRDRREGNVGVFVNVRPAQKGARGARSPDDPYYWRWLEFGRQARAAVAARVRVVRDRAAGIKSVRSSSSKRSVGAIEPRRFLRTALNRSSEALKVIVQKLGPQIDKMNRKGGTR